MSYPEDERNQRGAERFPINVDVEMKRPGSEQGTVCATRDVSSRGVFLLTDQALPENSPVEFTMRLRSPGAPLEGIQVVCSGTVVRVESPDDGNAGVAATIDSYRFLHQTRGKA